MLPAELYYMVFELLAFQSFPGLWSHRVLSITHFVMNVKPYGPPAREGTFGGTACASVFQSAVTGKPNRFFRATNIIYVLDIIKDVN
jgi:hypothetical protein